MKKILFILFCPVAFIGASAQTGKVSVNAGFLFPSTLNATLGYEYPLSYGNAVEVYGEVGNHWQKPVCHNFWKGYFWNGGMVYKHRLARYKNGMMRLVWGLSSVRYRRSSSSDWRPDLNTAMCSAADWSSLSYRRTM